MSLKSSGHFVRLAYEIKVFGSQTAVQNPANRDNLPPYENRDKKEKKEN